MITREGCHGHHDRSVRQRNVLPRSQGLARPASSSSATACIRWASSARSAPAYRMCSAARSSQITSIISEGRHESEARLIAEAQKHGAHGITGVTQRAAPHAGQCRVPLRRIVRASEGAACRKCRFSSSSDGQELYCHLDCGYHAEQVRHRQCRLLGRRWPAASSARSRAWPAARSRNSATSSTHTRHLALEPNCRGGARGRRQCRARHRDPRHAVQRRA